MAKKKIGDIIKVEGEDKVIIGLVDQHAHNGKKKTVTKKKLRPQPKNKADITETHEEEVPVEERTAGYLIQDPTLPWKRMNCTWVRASEVK